MSQIKLLHSGGNGVILSAPDSNPASDRTLKLPGDGDGTVDTLSRAGNILQVVQTVKTDVTSFTSNSSSTYADISGMSASITPSSSSNKILVTFTVNVSTSTSDRNNSIKLLRGSTDICVGTAGTSLNVTIADKTFANKYLMNFSHTFLDSPSTTSATTYKLQWACEGSGGNQTYYLNRKGSGTGEGTASTITLMEVAA